MTLSLIKIVDSTTVDGPGFRTAIYGAGCLHHCLGCHNPASWQLEAGNPTSIDEIVEHIGNNHFEQVTFSGGDPFFQVEPFAILAQRIKEQFHKNIWCYTGYTFEQLAVQTKAISLLKLIDVLVDGKFCKDLAVPSLRFRGSTNQRFIDVQASLKAKKTILMDL